MTRPRRIYDEAGVSHDFMHASSKAESSVQFPTHDPRNPAQVSGGHVSQAFSKAELSLQFPTHDCTNSAHDIYIIMSNLYTRVPPHFGEFEFA